MSFSKACTQSMNKMLAMHISVNKPFCKGLAARWLQRRTVVFNAFGAVGRATPYKLYRNVVMHVHPFPPSPRVLQPLCVTGLCHTVSIMQDACFLASCSLALTPDVS